MPTKRLCDSHGNILSKNGHLDVESKKKSPPKEKDDVPEPQTKWFGKNKSHSRVTLADATSKESITKCPNPRSVSMDIVAIVSSLSLNLFKKKANFLLCDPSLPPKSCAKIELSGDRIIQLILQSKIRRGDVIQFNGVSIKKNNAEEVTTTSLAERKDDNASDHPSLPAILLEFHQPWRNREVTAGNEPFIKLSSGGKISMNAKIDGCVTISGGATSHAHIQNMLDWFHSHFVADLSSGLPITSCKRRRLCEITAPNLLSDVTVRVLSLDTASSKIYALLSDGTTEEDILTFQCTDRFTSLRSSFDRGRSEKCRLLITRLLSQWAQRHQTKRQRLGNHHHDGSIVLEPTDGSQVIFLEEEEGEGSVVTNTSIDWMGTEPTQLSPQKRDPIQVITMESRIVDIFLDKCNVSILEHSKTFWESPKDLMKLLITTDDHSIHASNNNAIQKKHCVYRNATITLLQNISKNPPSITTTTTKACSFSKHITAKMDGKALGILCGSVPPEELINERHDGLENNETLPRLVTSLLLGLINEKANLVWTLEKEKKDGRNDDDNPWQVMDARLPQL